MLANTLSKEGQKLATKVLLFQTWVVLVLTVATGLIFSMSSAMGVVVGGMMNIIPNIVFALLAFRFSGASQNELVVRSFSQGAKVKLILTIVIAVVAFKALEIKALAVLSGFIVMTVSHWLAMVMCTEKIRIDNER